MGLHRAATRAAFACLVVTTATFVTVPAAFAGPAPGRRSPSHRPAPSTIAQVAETQVGVGDLPVSTDWSMDCDPYTTLVGVKVSAAGCGTSRRFGVRERNELWCADFAKWVWRRGGVTKDLSALTPAANSFYAWGKAEGDVLTPDGHNAAPGDAVVFYPDGALTSSGLSTADHVGIVVAVNSNGTVDLVNGDFLGAKNIGVQRDDNVSVASWAAGIWHSDEQWIYISPV
jgi:cell wall-associated NlpC family hydrolase